MMIKLLHQYRTLHAELADMKRRRATFPTADGDREVISVLINRLEEQLAAADNAVAALDNPEARIILRMRYMDGLSWRTIACRVHYSESQTRRIARRALKYLEEHYDA